MARRPYYTNWEGSGAQDTYERNKINNLAKIQESETARQIQMQDGATKRAEDIKNRALQLAIPEGAEANPQFMAAYSSFMNADRNAPADAMEIRKSAIQAGLAAMSSNALQRDETAYAQKQNMIPDPQQLRRAAALGSEQGLERGGISNTQNKALTDYMATPGKMDRMYGAPGAQETSVSTSPVLGAAKTESIAKPTITQNENVARYPIEQAPQSLTRSYLEQEAPSRTMKPGWPGIGENIYDFMTKDFEPWGRRQAAPPRLSSPDTQVVAPPNIPAIAPIATPAAPALPDFGIPEKFTNEDLVNQKIREALLKRNEYRRKNGISSSFQSPTSIASPQFSSSEYSPYRTEQNGDITRSYYR